MAKEFARPFYNSAAWKDCRRAYIKQRVRIDGGMCETCKEELGYIVHHKTMLTEQNIDDPDVSLNFNNLRYDCKACHDREEEHAFIKGAQARCVFDAEGNPMPRSGKWKEK